MIAMDQLLEVVKMAKNDYAEMAMRLDRCTSELIDTKSQLAQTRYDLAEARRLGLDAQRELAKVRQEIGVAE